MVTKDIIQLYNPMGISIILLKRQTIVLKHMTHVVEAEEKKPVLDEPKKPEETTEAE